MSRFLNLGLTNRRYQGGILVLQLRFGPWEVGFNTPSQVSKFKSTSEGFVGDPFMPSKPHVPKISPLGFMGLAHEPFLECF